MLHKRLEGSSFKWNLPFTVHDEKHHEEYEVSFTKLVYGVSLQYTEGHAIVEEVILIKRRILMRV